ncbi:hypothetical protein F8M41_007783 [Gigaspora margarita]|uniref:Uncharacterized protein n=1 Tax=Gigaspora margarita TaxID=4874 RepID=A0A8H4B499_GIGMA|nr:hypothetical protein F8M41_007783 [Gigaspora margarita]
MLKAQCHQMNESLLYRAKEIKDWKLLIDSQDHDLEDNNKSKNNDIKFVEDDYKSSMLNLYLMMQDLDLASVHKVWSISTIEGIFEQ